MSEGLRARLVGFFCVLMGIALGGVGLLLLLDFDPFDTPISGWRDHPFDLANIRFTLSSLTLSSRLWGYDPLHLFGWTPNVFYNPLATLAGSLFVGAGGGGEGAYRWWLVVVLLSTGLCFLPLLPRAPGRTWAWVAGGLLPGWLSLLVYPQDVGILDANPVQVLYTGQWAQRIGAALGLLALERFVSALRAVDGDLRLGARRALTAAALLGCALFSHFMSAYATAAAMAFSSLFYLAARRLSGAGWSLRCLLVLPAALAAVGLLFADFFFVLLSVHASHHHLPLLQWQVPEAVLAAVREVALPAIPVMLIPLARLLYGAGRSRPVLSRCLHPLLILALVWLASPANLWLVFVLATAASLLACRLEGGLHVRHWLPPVALLTLWLACGPASLELLGLDLSTLIPFGSSVGWAKLAAFARFAFLAWLGVLVVEGLFLDGHPRRSFGRFVAGVLAWVGLALPLGLSLGEEGRTGAQTFLDWMQATDEHATRELIGRMRQVARQTSADGYLLIEDSLHHPPESLLRGRNLPFGHLPFLIGPDTSRPVLGGAVTTRLITHPQAHTSRSRLLCQSYDAIARNPTPVIEALGRLSVSDLLVHNRRLIRALHAAPGVQRIDQHAGMVHFRIDGHRPMLSDEQGRALAMSQVRFEPGAVRIRLPTGRTGARLRQVWYPFLACDAQGPTGSRGCRLTAWTEGRQTFRGCLLDDPRAVEVELPWIAVEVEADPKGPVTVAIESRPAPWPFVLMLSAWLVAVVGRLTVLR